MKEFKTYHPIVNLIYFVLVIGFSMFFMHPVCLCISLVCGFLYSVMLKGKKTVKKSLAYMIPMLVLAALINPLFNHSGVTVITYLAGGNPLTFESVIYGLASAVMIISVILWFSCYNQVMTSDKFIYLFGKIIPSMSLVVSMTLRFVPEFTRRFKAVSDAQRCMGRSLSGGIINRVKCGLSILSATLSWSMENAVETADSMKARGFGLPDRTAFSIYIFDKRDTKVLFGILLLGSYTLLGSLTGGVKFTYFPAIQSSGFSLFNVSVFVSYLLLCVYPIIIEIVEVKKWK